MQRELKIARGQILTVLIRGRDTVHYGGKASAISSKNNKGPLDILPRHTHFISLIQDGVTIHKTDGSTQKINFVNAVLKVKDDKVEIYIGLDKK